MKILITGSAGFIASHLAKKLLSLECDVIGIDNFDPFYDIAIKEKNIVDLCKYPNYTFHKCDVRDKSAVAEILSKNVDLVIHLAAKAGVRPSILTPGEYFDVNINGTLSILEAMRATKTNKLLFASSSSVYGNNTSIPFNEKDPVDNPISPYAMSKKSCELLLYTYYFLYGIKSISMRLFTVYGPNQRPEMGIAQFIRKIQGGQLISLYGQGNSSRDYTYIEDIVNGVTSLIEKIDSYDIVNLGNNSPVKLIELISKIENELHKKAVVELLDTQPGDVDITYADIAHAKQKYGYSVNWTLENGLKEQIDHFLKNGH